MVATMNDMRGRVSANISVVTWCLTINYPSTGIQYYFT